MNFLNDQVSLVCNARLLTRNARVTYRNRNRNCNCNGYAVGDLFQEEGAAQRIYLMRYSPIWSALSNVT